MENSEKFIIRVYGIAIHNGHLLVCDEVWFDTLMTKLPGGGLEFGEGTTDCLKRECMEEFGQQVEVLSHFYTTDFYQPTRFLKDKQLISIYYRMQLPDPAAIGHSAEINHFPDRQEGSMAFRWAPLKELNVEDFTFPIDRHVAGMLLKECM